MSKLEVLCVTMHQTDFSKIEKMNIRTDVVFANQADKTDFEELEFDGNTAKMVTTTTRGVGINRNIALMYASAEYCMLADDDVVYFDNMPQKVVSEFEKHPDADVVIFNLSTDDAQRKQRQYKRTKKCSRFERMPWAAFRAAFRLSAVRKANVWFTALFGGGALFPSGEDSMFFEDLRKAGLTFYISKETIGNVSFEKSTWFDGVNEKYFYGKGAFYQALHPRVKYFWMLYFALRMQKNKDVRFFDKLKWMSRGAKGFVNLVNYDDYINSQE